MSDIIASNGGKWERRHLEANVHSGDIGHQVQGSRHFHLLRVSIFQLTPSLGCQPGLEALGGTLLLVRLELTGVSKIIVIKGLEIQSNVHV